MLSSRSNLSKTVISRYYLHYPASREGSGFLGKLNLSLKIDVTAPSHLSLEANEKPKMAP